MDTNAETPLSIAAEAHHFFVDSDAGLESQDVFNCKHLSKAVFWATTLF